MCDAGRIHTFVRAADSILFFTLTAGETSCGGMMPMLTALAKPFIAKIDPKKSDGWYYKKMRWGLIDSTQEACPWSFLYEGFDRSSSICVFFRWHLLMLLSA